MVYGPVSVCKIAPVCSGLLWALVLSLIDRVSEAVECMVGNTGNCMIRFLSLSMPNVIICMS